jgi:hypothetical protein
MLSISPAPPGMQGDWEGQRDSEKVNVAEGQNGVNYAMWQKRAKWS